MGAPRPEDGGSHTPSPPNLDLTNGFFANALSHGIVDPADYVKIPFSRNPSLLSHLKSHIFGISYSNIEDDYILGPQLGEGLTGIIRYCVDRKSGNSFACKSLPKDRMVSMADIASVRTEINALRRLSDHPAVAGMQHLAEDDKFVHIILDLGEGGDLFDRIQKRGRFSEETSAKLLRSLFSVLHYSHSYGIMHRDIKPENILMTSALSDTSVKVIDFGQSVFVEKGVRLTHPIGTPYYIAPEVLDCSYGLEADMWSCGIVLYVLLCGSPPFWEESLEDTFKKIRKGDLDLSNGPWHDISVEAKDLVRRLLCRDPLKRITAQEAKVHPWILRHCGSVQSQISPRVPPSHETENSRNSKRVKTRQRTSTKILSENSSYLTEIPLTMEMDLTLAAIPQSRVLSMSETLNLFGESRSNSKRNCAVEMKNVQGSSDHSRYKLEQNCLNSMNASLLSMTVRP